MIFITLAAGNGIRMGTQGILTPKTLLSISKNTKILDTQHVLAHQLKATQHIVVVGKHFSLVTDHCSTKTTPRCKTIFNPWYHSPSPLFSLIRVIPIIVFHDVIIANGDTAYSRTFAKNVTLLQEKNGIFLFFSQINTHNPTDMKLVVLPDGVVNKAHTPDSSSNLISTGLVMVGGIFYRFAFILSIIQAVILYWFGQRGHWHQVFNGLLSTLKLTQAIRISQKTWFEVDTPQDLVAMKKHVATYF